MTPEVRPGDAPVLGPAAAVVVEADRWRGTAGWHVVYADLDLAERAATARALGLDGEPGDLAIVRAALARWGADAPTHLGGQFAVAAWDGDRQRVVAFRDGVGLRGLVYAARPGRLVVGGDVRAVLAGGVSDDLDEDVMVAVLLDDGFRPVSIGRTGFRAVDQLRGGDRLSWDGAQATVDTWWAPQDVPRLGARSVGEVGEAVRAVLRTVTADLVANGGPVGVHLSPGIDSTAVAAFAAEALGAPPPAFSWQWPPGDAPLAEHARVQCVADRWGLPVAWCPVTVEDYLAVFALDPLRDPMTMWPLEAPVRRAAAAQGVAVMLTGWGGDEGVSANGRGRVPTGTSRTPWGALATGWARGLHAVRRRLRPRPPRRPPTLAALREAALAGRHTTFLRAEVLRRAVLPEPPPPPDALGDYYAWLWRRGHLGARAEAWARAGAPQGLQYRYPLLDRRVLAVVMGLRPEAWLAHDGMRRWPLRAAVDGLVPDLTRLHPGKAEPGWLDARRAVWSRATARAAPFVPAAAGSPIGELLDLPALADGLATWIAAGGPAVDAPLGHYPLLYLPFPPF